MSEHAFQSRLLVEFTRIPGVRVHRQNVGTVRIHGTQRRFRAGPARGACDISGIVAPGGWRIEVECKAIGGERTEEQIAYSEMVIAHGGIYYLADEGRGVEACVADVCALIAARRGAPVVPNPPKRRGRAGR